MNWILKGEKDNLRELLSGISPNCILDIGTGTGSTLDLLPETDICFGIDSSLPMLMKTPESHIFFKIAAQAEQLPFKRDSFDLITVIGVCEYIRNLNILYNEGASVLKTNGYLLLTGTPPSIWTSLRKGLGNRIYARTSESITLKAEKHGFKLVAAKKSLMQEQLLYQLC